MEIVGLIGVGLLGTAIAQRLCEEGLRVRGFDIDSTRGSALRKAGGEWAESSSDVARSCRCIVLSLPNSTVVRQVIEQVEPSCSPGTVIVDTTTGSPNESVRLAQQLSAVHVAWLDATVVGSSQQMRQHEAIMLVGGPDEVFRDQLPLMQHLAQQVFHLGPNGSGARMKLVVNLVLGLNRAVLAEGLSLAQSLGFDLATTLEVLQASAAYSQVMDTKGPKMLRGDFTPHARLAQHLKDVHLILATAASCRQQLPLSDAHRQLLESLVRAGHGDLDNSAIIKAFERL